MNEDFLAAELKREMKKFRKERAKLIREIKQIEAQISVFAKVHSWLTRNGITNTERRRQDLTRRVEYLNEQLKENQFYESFFRVY